MDLQLQDTAAVVTGASRGIGRGIAAGLAAEGCRVLICARGDEDLERCAEEIRGAGGDVRTLSLDVSVPEAGERLAAAVRREFGAVDVFVANAGANRRKPLVETTDEDWAAVIDVNLMAHVRCSRALIPLMRETGPGSIVFIASIFGRESGGAGLSIYNATKSALISTAKVMAEELGPSGIRVNSVAPGSIRFPGGSWDRRCEEDPEGMADFVADNIPMGRFGTVEEIADVVTFLASPRAGWVSGACINVDGVQSRSLI